MQGSICGPCAPAAGHPAATRQDQAEHASPGSLADHRGTGKAGSGFPRDRACHYRGTGGNLAITGAPGTGKTVLLQGLAAAQSAAGTDLVMLNSENLGSTAGQTRGELNITHDLADVLAGWTGSGPGLLLIDGLDQARGAGSPAWLPDLARALDQTRWQIVATIRTYDLKHGLRWREMFAGHPVAAAADPELAGVRHLVVGDLTDPELAPLRQASPRLADLSTGPVPGSARCWPIPSTWTWRGSSSRIPVPISLASAIALSFSTGTGIAGHARDRGAGPGAYPARASPVDAQRRQAGGKPAQPAARSDTEPPSRHCSTTACCGPSQPPGSPGPAGRLRPPGALRLRSRRPGARRHGRARQPGRRARRGPEPRDHRPPEPRCTGWPSSGPRTATRRAFWHLALRLASRTAGHPLAAVTAAQVAADAASIPDVEELDEA